MPTATVTVRTLIEPDDSAIVCHLAEALVDAGMEDFASELVSRLKSGAGVIESRVQNGVTRVALQPFAKLMLLDILEIAARPAIPLAIRERLSREAMRAAGYLDSGA